jgi:hypothetical protein
MSAMHPHLEGRTLAGSPARDDAHEHEGRRERAAACEIGEHLEIAVERSAILGNSAERTLAAARVDHHGVMPDVDLVEHPGTRGLHRGPRIGGVHHRDEVVGVAAVDGGEVVPRPQAVVHGEMVRAVRGEVRCCRRC